MAECCGCTCEVCDHGHQGGFHTPSCQDVIAQRLAVLDGSVPGPPPAARAQESECHYCNIGWPVRSVRMHHKPSDTGRPAVVCATPAPEATPLPVEPVGVRAAWRYETASGPDDRMTTLPFRIYDEQGPAPWPFCGR